MDWKLFAQLAATASVTVLGWGLSEGRVSPIVGENLNEQNKAPPSRSL